MYRFLLLVSSSVNASTTTFSYYAGTEFTTSAQYAYTTTFPHYDSNDDVEQLTETRPYRTTENDALHTTGEYNNLQNSFYGSYGNYTTVLPGPDEEGAVDICLQVCNRFSASELGNGFDLCNAPEQSRCEYNVTAGWYLCTNLFWSFTEEDEDGLVYEIDMSQLSANELGRPLYCLDAEYLLRRPTSPLSSSSEDEEVFWVRWADSGLPEGTYESFTVRRHL